VRLAAVLTLLAAATAGCRCGSPADVARGAPVVVVSIDTLRADHLPAYGYGGVETPAIESLRRDGVLFTRAYTTCPLTLPAHASLLTGLLPHRHGVRDNLGYRLDGGATPTIADFLRRRGYATAAAVSAYVLRRSTGVASGFDHFDDAVGVEEGEALGEIARRGMETVDGVLPWLRDHAAGPFFLFVHLFEPHAPYDPPEPFRSRTPESLYDGEIATADAAVGRLLAELRSLGAYDRALIVLLADHGEGLGDHGEDEHGVLLYGATLRVPLIVKYPAGVGAGTTVEAPAQLVDLFATVAEWTAGEVPPDLDGTPLRLSPPFADRLLYAETFYPQLHLGWSPLRTLVGERWQYIEAPRPELYDLHSDPGATTSVIAAERRLAGELARRLATIPLGLEAPGAAAPEEAARLAALGYLTGPAAAGQPAVNPRDVLPALRELKLAYELAGKREHQAAVARLRSLVERHPGMLDARFQLAWNLARSGSLEAALAEYEAAARGSAVVLPGIEIERARIALQVGRPAEAESRARVAAASLPVEAHEVLARVAAARDDALGALSEAGLAHAAESPPRASSILLLAEARLAAGGAADALALLDPLREEVEAGARRPLAQLEYLRGECLARLGRSSEAERAFRAEIERYPANLRAHGQLGLLLASLRRRAEVEPLLRAMVAGNPPGEACAVADAVLRRLGRPAASGRWEACGAQAGPGPAGSRG
jgi:arylsulfatase A-like enzyme